jgi:DNA-binding transcriptional LysR family regulator
MYYTWLRSFHIVAHESEFMKGTNAIGVGQPTVTAQVQSLKSAFGVELFHRDENPLN